MQNTWLIRQPTPSSHLHSALFLATFALCVHVVATLSVGSYQLAVVALVSIFLFYPLCVFLGLSFVGMAFGQLWGIGIGIGIGIGTC